MNVETVLLVGRTTPGSLEDSYARALALQGLQVHRWNPDAAIAAVARGGAAGRLFSTFVHVEAWVRTANLQLLQVAIELRPDLILVIGTTGVRGGTLAQIRVLLPHCLLYCVYPDSPHHLDRDRIHCLPFFDRVTVSSPPWVDSMVRLGAQAVTYLPFAADTQLHSPATSVDRSLEHDVAFIGTWRKEREEILTQLADFDLCVWGSKYWKTRTAAGSPLRDAWGGRPVTGREFASVCASSRILLNIMDPPTMPGPNMRVFEQAACGAFSLVTRSPAVLELFREGETIECFDSIDEAREKIHYYLKHEAKRRAVANAAYRLVTEGGHTYRDRVASLITLTARDREAKGRAIA